MLEVHLLGPTEAVASNVAVPLSPLARNVLAILALSQGTIVSTDRIIDFLWADRTPAAPRSRVQGLVSTLRRAIGDVLLTRHPGYVLDSAGCVTDIRQLDDLTRRARQAATPERKAAYLRAALALWRGDPLDGVTAPGVEVDRARLAEMRVGLLEDRFEADLELGHHAELVAELTATLAAHPLRERLAGQLMLALYRSNRQADALRTYQELAARLADELGSDPCPDLRELQLMILRGEPDHRSALPAVRTPAIPVTPAVPATPARVATALQVAPAQATAPPVSVPPAPQAPPAAPYPMAPAGEPPPAQLPAQPPAQLPSQLPAQLPATVGHFTGREDDLAALRRAVDRRGDEPRVVVVTGLGGLGKTALVVRWAHSALAGFPDGQLFLDLHGSDTGSDPAARLTPADALASVLTALGVDSRRMPAGLDERAALYRTLVSGRRLLVVADDAATIGQVLPLVPPTPESQLVVTSRFRLGTLAVHHAADLIPLEPLGDDASRELLARIVGRDRLREPAAARVTRWCGGYPLALRTVGARLAARPGQPLESFVDELGEETGNVLAGHPRGVRAAFTSAYRSLSPAAAHLFGRLGLQSGSSVCLPLPAGGTSGRLVRRLLDELVAVNLVSDNGGDDRHGAYRFHDLVHRFANECGAEIAIGDAVDEWRIAIGSELNA
jgi:DNA-binding SARP family transcriptional activator